MVADTMKTMIDGKGIKYTFIAEKTGLSPDRVSKVLNRQRKMLADEMISICEVTGIQLADLAQAVQDAG